MSPWVADVSVKTNKLICRRVNINHRIVRLNWKENNERRNERLAMIDDLICNLDTNSTFWNICDYIRPSGTPLYLTTIENNEPLNLGLGSNRPKFGRGVEILLWKLR